MPGTGLFTEAWTRGRRNPAAHQRGAEGAATGQSLPRPAAGGSAARARNSSKMRESRFSPVDDEKVTCTTLSCTRGITPWKPPSEAIPRTAPPNGAEGGRQLAKKPRAAACCSAGTPAPAARRTAGARARATAPAPARILKISPNFSGSGGVQDPQLLKIQLLTNLQLSKVEVVKS